MQNDSADHESPPPFVASALLLDGLGRYKSDPSGALVELALIERSGPNGNEVTVAGVSLTFPNEWKVVGISKGQLDAAIAPFSKAAMTRIAQAVASKGMVKLIVSVRNGSKPGFVSNVSLVVPPGVGAETMDQILDMTKPLVATLDPDVAASKVTFPRRRVRTA